MVGTTAWMNIKFYIVTSKFAVLYLTVNNMFKFISLKSACMIVLRQLVMRTKVLSGSFEVFIKHEL